MSFETLLIIAVLGGVLAGNVIGFVVSQIIANIFIWKLPIRRALKFWRLP